MRSVSPTTQTKYLKAASYIMDLNSFIKATTTYHPKNKQYQGGEKTVHHEQTVKQT